MPSVRLRTSTLRTLVPGVLLSLVLVACGDPVEVVLPDSNDEGIQATGTLDGARVAISRGNPFVIVGDCDLGDGDDDDLCIRTRTIDGLDVEIVIENPAVLEPGASLPVGGTCAGRCDTVTGSVVIDVRLIDGSHRANRGTLHVREAGPRWIADFDIELPGNSRLIGTFDVVPSPVE